MKTATPFTALITDALKIISTNAKDAVDISVVSVENTGAVNYTATSAMFSHTMTDRDHNT